MKAIKINRDETIEFAPDCEIQRWPGGGRKPFIVKMLLKSQNDDLTGGVKRKEALKRKTNETNLSLFVSFRVFDVVFGGRLQVFAKFVGLKAARSSLSHQIFLFT